MQNRVFSDWLSSRSEAGLICASPPTAWEKTMRRTRCDTCRSTGAGSLQALYHDISIPLWYEKSVGKCGEIQKIEKSCAEKCAV